MDSGKDEYFIKFKQALNDEKEKNNKGMFFTDRIRRIDFVLVYQQLRDNEEKQNKRISFIESLKGEGLEIEIQSIGGRLINIRDSGCENSDDNTGTSKNLVFVKIHASWDTLCRYAEIMKIQKPIMNAGVDYNYNFKSFFEKFVDFDFFRLFSIDKTKLKPLAQGYTYPFSKQKSYLFDISVNRSDFFTPVERSLIVNYILKRKDYKLNRNPITKIWDNKNLEMEQIHSNKINDSQDSIDKEIEENETNLNIGIAKLISEKVFETAFILHEPKKKLSKRKYYKENMRVLLYKHWSTKKNTFRHQPLDHIRLYFGEMVAFYFAWLGFYTFWLLPIALFGVFVTIYNITTTFQDTIIREINVRNNITMCPVFCIKGSCEPWKLSAGYVHFFLIRLIDNGATVVLAGVVSVWVFLFLEMWNRKQFTLAYRWNVHDLELEDEPLRPEFAALLEKNYKSEFNKISGKDEPYISFWRNTVPIKMLTCSTILFSIVLTLACLTGITITKTIIRNLLRLQLTYVMSKLSTAAIGSLISLIAIIILTSVYSRVAVWLTDLEHHRTQSQYDDSVTGKLYILEFINNYSSMFYIGFVYPYTKLKPASDSFSLIKPQGCLTGDCLLDLSMQLIFILVGKQIISNIINITIPRLCSSIREYRVKQNDTKFNKRLSHHPTITDYEVSEVECSGEFTDCNGLKLQSELKRCYEDYILSDPEPRPLFKEYLEMIIQFGFITIFILPFPLAPLLALINNLLEIRSDALKFVTVYRRPIAQRVKDIGIWKNILTTIAKIVVTSNALLIAFATSYIDRVIYVIVHSRNFDLGGFVDFSLSFMNSTEFHISSSIFNETHCGYIGFRYPPWDKNNEPLSYTPVFWQMLAAKIAFVYLFETFVLLFVKIFSMIIPNIPDAYRIAMKREAAITNEFILKIELEEHQNKYESKNLTKSWKKTIINYRQKLNKQNSKQRSTIIQDILQANSKDNVSNEEGV